MQHIPPQPSPGLLVSNTQILTGQLAMQTHPDADSKRQADKFWRVSEIFLSSELTLYIDVSGEGIESRSPGKAGQRRGDHGGEVTCLGGYLGKVSTKHRAQLSAGRRIERRDQHGREETEQAWFPL